jgi:hypothetical protein
VLLKELSESGQKKNHEKTFLSLEMQKIKIFVFDSLVDTKLTPFLITWFFAE